MRKIYLSVSIIFAFALLTSIAKTAGEYFEAAQGGDPEAQSELGLCYIEGRGIKINYIEAVKWFRKAARQNYAEAQYQLALCYTKGQGVAQNYKKAVELLEKAAKQEHVSAQYQLAICYTKGQGVTQDYKKAVRWYKEAGLKGHKLAQYQMALYYTKIENFKKTAEWFEKAAKKGHVLAQYKLAVYYTKGQGIKQNYKKAAEWFDKAAKQIMMAAVLAEGTTTIRNAASEPHVTDLAELLNKMGAKISGLGSNTLIIEGVEKLHGTEHHIVSDHTEAGSFLALGAVCGGELTLKGITPRHYWMTRRVFERLGVEMEIKHDNIYLPPNQKMKVIDDFDGHCPVISDGPWPQFPSDLMSVAIVLATQVNGSVLFFEKMFESRIYFVDRLMSMGAKAIVCDPHRVVINGPAKLRGTKMSSPDIRAGMAMLIAAMCAKGESQIHSADVIYRGYENVVEKLLSIGCNISTTRE